jgi:hypothetical protein
MRICLVSQEYPPESGHGGIATQTYLKATGLSGLGHDVVVVSHSPDGTPTDVRRDGVRVVRVAGPDERMSVRSEPLRWIEWSGDVARAIDRLHAEVGFDLVDVPEFAGEGFEYALNRAEWDPALVV